jgi:hypothetical protein
MRFGANQLAGLGLLPRLTVVPHFERSTSGRVEELRESLRDDGAVLALDGATGCYSSAEVWTVAGQGRAHVISARRVEVFAHGDTFTLP